MQAFLLEMTKMSAGETVGCGGPAFRLHKRRMWRVLDSEQCGVLSALVFLDVT